MSDKFKYDGYNVIRMSDNHKTTFAHLDSAMDYVEREVGNRSYAKPFPEEDTYLFGPGDGSTTYMIRNNIVGWADS